MGTGVATMLVLKEIGEQAFVAHEISGGNPQFKKGDNLEK